MDNLPSDSDVPMKWWKKRPILMKHKSRLKLKHKPFSKLSIIEGLISRKREKTICTYELTKKNKIRSVNHPTLNVKRQYPSHCRVTYSFQSNPKHFGKRLNDKRKLHDIIESSSDSLIERRRNVKTRQVKHVKSKSRRETKLTLLESKSKEWQKKVKSTRRDPKIQFQQSSSKEEKHCTRSKACGSKKKQTYHPKFQSQGSQQKIVFQCPSKARFPKFMSKHLYNKSSSRSTQPQITNGKTLKTHRKPKVELIKSKDKINNKHNIDTTTTDGKNKSIGTVSQCYVFTLETKRDKKSANKKKPSKLLLGNASSYVINRYSRKRSFKRVKNDSFSNHNSFRVVNQWKKIQNKPNTNKEYSESCWSTEESINLHKNEILPTRLVNIQPTTVMKVNIEKTHPENVDCVCCTCPSRHYPPPKDEGDGTAVDEGTTMAGDNLYKARKSACVDTKKRHKKGVSETSAATTDKPTETRSTGAGPAPPKVMKSAFHLKKYKRDELRKKKIKFEKTPPTLKEIKNMTEQQIKIKFKAPYIERDEAPEADAEEFRRSVRDKKKLSELYPWLEDPSVEGTEACKHVCCRCPDPYKAMTKSGAYPEEGVPFGGGWGSYHFGAQGPPGETGAPGAPGAPGEPGAGAPPMAAQELQTKGAYAPGGMYGPPLSYGAKGKFPPAGDWQTQMGAKALPAGWPPPGWVPPGWVPPPGQTPPPWRAPPGWKPPMGWTPPPGSRPPEGWEKPKDWPPIDGSIPKPPTIGRIPPDGWVPPGWKPPPDQKVVKWDPPENWVPPPGWTPPPGSTPPKEFMPPEGWVPPGWKPPPGIKEPIEWTPPPNWIPPPGWTPPKGAIPPPGYIPPAGSKPPPEFYPPEGWVPPGWKPSPAYNPPPKWLPPPMWLPPPDWKPPPGSLPPKSWMPPKRWLPPGWTPRPGMKVAKWNSPPLWFPPNRWKPPAGAKPPPVTVIPPLWEPPEKYQPPVDYLQPAPKGFYYDDNDKLKKTAKFDRQVKKQAKIEKKEERERIMKLKEQGHDYVLTLDAGTGKFVLEQKIPDPPPVCTHEKCICQPYTEEELQKMMGENICEENLCTCPTQYKKDAYADNVRLKEMELAAKEAWIRYMEMRRAKLAKILAALEPIRRKELAEALKAQIMARRKKAIICKCPLEMTVDEILRSYNSDFRAKFRDRIRLVDFILVMKDSGELRVEQMCANYLTGALKTGLEIELERGVMPCNNALVFAKVHAPAHVIEKYGRAFGIRKFFKSHHIYCVPSPEREYVEVCRDATPKPTMYSTHDRAMIVNQILLHLPYGTDTNDYGYDRLVRKGVFRDGYALHDGPYFFVSNQVADKAQLRQVLYYNWAAPTFVCFKSCPILMIQEYMGERVASFFLFYSFYNFALFVLCVLAFACSLFGYLATVVYSSVGTSVSYACSGKISGQVLCPVCADFKRCPLKTFVNHYCISNKIDNTLDNSVLILELYSILLLLWAIMVPFMWGYKERKLKWLWECSTATSRAQVNYLRMRLPQVIKQLEDTTFFIIKTVITYLVLIVLMAGFIACVFLYVNTFRYKRDDLFDKWSKAVVKKVELIRLFSLLINGLLFGFVSVLFATAVKHLVYLLTHLERHTLFMHYERSIVVKYFIITLVTSFSVLIYLAFLRGVGYQSPLVKAEFMGLKFMYDICGPFNICLHEILIIYVCLVFVKQFIFPLLWWSTRILTCDKTCCTKYPVWERELLLAPLTEKMIMDRYDYIVDQFAYIVTFGLVFPLMTIPCLLCNCYDYCYTAKLFLKRHRRPLLPRFAGIGSIRGALFAFAFASIWLHAGIFAVQTKLAERHVYRAYSHTYKNDTYFDYLGIQLPTPDYLEAPNVDPTISSKFNEVQKGNISEIKTKWVRPWYLVPRYSVSYISYGDFTEKHNQCFAPIQYRMTMFLPAYQTDIKDFHNQFGSEHPQKWVCGSECYAVKMTRSKIFIIYLVFIHFIAWLIMCLFGSSSRIRQVRVAEAKILSAIVRGDRRRSRKSVAQDYSSYCPNC
ncbi:hypothetical protein JYU34_020569 [Plutella xylostella]|uniref:Anoctamin n=1 Tax=Plutella xylostella TaxID=51655 RepID=A0ABQ7PYG1_PLUXY|nr:hypothetical protein JYU34_020569 [Plutella xylostella]